MTPQSSLLHRLSLVFSQQHFRCHSSSPTLLPCPPGQKPVLGKKALPTGGCGVRVSCSVLWRVRSFADSPDAGKDGSWGQETQLMTPILGVLASRLKVWKPWAFFPSGNSWSLSNFSVAKKGWMREEFRCLCSWTLPSELLQTTVHLPFALFSCPGPAFGAEFL